MLRNSDEFNEKIWHASVANRVLVGELCQKLQVSCAVVTLLETRTLQAVKSETLYENLALQIQAFQDGI